MDAYMIHRQVPTDTDLLAGDWPLAQQVGSYKVILYIHITAESKDESQ